MTSRLTELKIPPNLARIMERSLDCFWLVDEAGKLKYGNPAACDLCGVQTQAFLKMTLEDLLVPSHSSTDGKWAQSLRSSEPFEAVCQLNQKKRLDLFLLEVQSLFLGPGLNLYCLQAFPKLTSPEESSEKLLSDLLDHFPAVVYVKDLDGRFTHLNQNFLNLFRVKRSDVIGKTNHEFFDRPVADRLWANDQRTIQSQVPDETEEVVYNFGGEPRCFRSLKFPVFDKKGSVVGVGGVSVDITEEKRAQKEIIEQRNKLLNSFKMASLGEMAAGVGHEINNPLAIIQGSAKRLTRINTSDASEKQKIAENVSLIMETTNRIAGIVRGLRSFAYQEDSLHPLLSSARALVHDTVGFCQQRLTSQGIDVEICIVPEDLMVLCRETQIQQVLINLLNNACDAVNGQVDGKIGLTVKIKDGNARFVVWDNGPGVDPDSQDKIFTAFFTTKPQGLGTGLGLSISKSIVESHEGRIWFERERALTSFCFEIPLGHSGA